MIPARRSSALVAALALAAASGALAADETPVALEVGKSVNLCKTGLAACPATQLICDEPKVARIDYGPEGPELKGIAPGATLCSVLGPGQAFRRVLRVTVKPAVPPRG